MLPANLFGQKHVSRNVSAPFVFHGPVQLQGAGPFSVADLQEINSKYSLLKEIGTIKRFYSVYDVYYGLLHFIQPSVITKCGFIPEKRS